MVRTPHKSEARPKIAQFNSRGLLAIRPSNSPAGPVEMAGFSGPRAHCKLAKHRRARGSASAAHRLPGPSRPGPGGTPKGPPATGRKMNQTPGAPRPKRLVSIPLPDNTRIDCQNRKGVPAVESKIELAERLRREGRWAEASRIKDEAMKEFRSKGIRIGRCDRSIWAEAPWKRRWGRPTQVGEQRSNRRPM